MTEATETAAQEWRRGWAVVLSAFVGFSFLSVMTGSLSMFMEPIADEFGWTRAFVSTGFTLAAVMTAVLSPVFGVLVDRYGSRRIALPGIVLTAFTISAFALTSGSMVQWIVLWFVYGCISISVKTTVWTAAVASVFTAGRGLALGLTLCGTAASQALLPPLTNALIDAFGWRTAYLYLGFGWGGITLLLALFFFFDAHDRRKAEMARTGNAAAGIKPDYPGLTVRQAWRSPALWRIVFSTFIIMMLTLGLSLHQIPILGEAGVSRSDAALLASMAGLAGIVGKLVTGALLDRYRANWVGGLTVAATALAFGLLIDGIHSPLLITLAMLANGYTQGAKLQISSYLTARYAGMRSFGTIYGFMNSVVAFGSAVGPVLAGFAYDSAGNYGPFLIVGVIGCVISGVLLITLPAYPDWDKEKEKERAAVAG